MIMLSFYELGCSRTCKQKTLFVSRNMLADLVNWNLDKSIN